jgi:hypothetical protein
MKKITIEPNTRFAYFKGIKEALKEAEASQARLEAKQPEAVFSKQVYRCVYFNFKHTRMCFI